MTKQALIERITAHFPQTLRTLDQWVLWRLEQRQGEKKPTKVPYATAGAKAESDNPVTWASFADACAAFLAGNYDGVGFVFSEHDPYAGIDFDGCVAGEHVDPQTDLWLRKLDSYSEFSQSGTGIHTIVIGKLPGGGRKSQKHGVEMYDRLRFFVVTGDHVAGAPADVRERQAELTALHGEIFPPKEKPQPTTPRTNGHAAIPADDEALLQRMFAARNGADIEALWRGSLSAHGDDESAADLALCNHLAFYTGNDAERMDRLFRQSGLMRDKWDRAARTGETYGAGTIARAIAATSTTYTGHRTNGSANGHSNGANGSNGHHSIYSASGHGATPPAPTDAPTSEETGCVRRRTYAEMLNEMRSRAIATYDEGLTVDCLFDSEEGDARLLCSIAAWNIVYDHAEGQWYWYNNLHWESDKTWNIYQLTSDVLSEVYRHLSIQKHAEAIDLEKAIYAADEPTQEQRDKLKKLNTISKTARARAGKLNEINEVKRVLGFAASGLRLGIAGNEWDATPFILPVRNGVIDLKTGTMIQPRPEQYIRSFAPVDFTGLDTPAPRFDQFLSEIFATQPELPGYIMRLFGYAISGSSTEHIFPIFWGAEGRNGKDTLLNAIQSVLGTDLADSVSNDVVLEAKGHRTAGAATPHLITLRGKRLVWASEPDEGARITPGLVKMITGGGRINARRPHDKNEVSFQPTHTLLLLTNHAPHAPSDDSALWERVKLCEFNQRFVDDPDPQKPNEHRKDPTLKDKLEAEKSGILAALARGCLEYQKVGLNPPDCIKFATTSYRIKEDTLQLFIDERCVVHPEVSAKAQALYDAYKEWCLQMNLRPMTGTSFGEKIAKRFTKERKTMGVFYVGIGVLVGNPI